MCMHSGTCGCMYICILRDIASYPKLLDNCWLLHRNSPTSASRRRRSASSLLSLASRVLIHHDNSWSLPSSDHMLLKCKLIEWDSNLTKKRVKQTLVGEEKSDPLPCNQPMKWRQNDTHNKYGYFHLFPVANTLTMACWVRATVSCFLSSIWPDGPVTEPMRNSPVVTCWIGMIGIEKERKRWKTK